MSGNEGVFDSGAEEVADELRQEFLDETEENLQALDVAINEVKNGRKSAEDLLDQIHRTVLPIRGQANNFKVPLIGTLAHRIENFVGHVKVIPPGALENLEKFVSVLIDVLDGSIPMESDASSLVRSLPAKIAFDETEIEVREVEALLVMLHGTATRFVERELNQCGYRTNTVSSAFDALPLIVHTKPDLVIVSAIMPDLSGIDLAIGLAAMPETRNIPIALITSLDADDEYLALLPKSIPIINKSASFPDDLAEALSNLFII